jgi:hypothetical protein
MATHAPKSGHPLGLDRESAPGGHLPFAGARASGEGCAESRASARRRHHPPGASYLQNRHRWLQATKPYRHQAGSHAQNCYSLRETARVGKTWESE